MQKEVPTCEYQDCSWEKDWSVGFGEGTTNRGHQPIRLLALANTCSTVNNNNILPIIIFVHLFAL